MKPRKTKEKTKEKTKTTMMRMKRWTSLARVTSMETPIMNPIQRWKMF
jgi:hypothetical protein